MTVSNKLQLEAHKNFSDAEVSEADIVSVINAFSPIKVYHTVSGLRKLITEYKDQFSTVKQSINAASIAKNHNFVALLPDSHVGYGFPIGCVAGYEQINGTYPIVAGGIGYDINCGVRCIRTNLQLSKIEAQLDGLLEALGKKILIGVGNQSNRKLSDAEVYEILERGASWAVERRLSWPEDLLSIESRGCQTLNSPLKFEQSLLQVAKKQLCSLGSGNHYLEVQVVEKIYDAEAAAAMGLTTEGQIVVSLHSGSRGFGHKLCQQFMEALRKDKEERLNRAKSKFWYRFPIFLPRRRTHRGKKIVCNLRAFNEIHHRRILARILPNEFAPAVDAQTWHVNSNSDLGQYYVNAMRCASNYAWANRSLLTDVCRSVFARVFGRSARDLDMGLVYDVSHNYAQLENHVIDGVEKTYYVHRKGATRSLPPNHPELPPVYRKFGQPVLVGGSMGAPSYILLGVEQDSARSLYTSVHGAGRQMSRVDARRIFQSDQVMSELEKNNVRFHVISADAIVEEAPGVYKDIDEVVKICESAGLNKRCVKLRPIISIKG